MSTRWSPRQKKTAHRFPVSPPVKTCIIQPPPSRSMPHHIPKEARNEANELIAQGVCVVFTCDGCLATSSDAAKLEASPCRGSDPRIAHIDIDPAPDCNRPHRVDDDLRREARMRESNGIRVRFVCKKCGANSNDPDTFDSYGCNP